MTRYLTLRSQDVGGAVLPAQAVDCDATVQPLGYDPVSADDMRLWVGGQDVVLAIHGFNAPRPHAVGALANLEKALALPPNYVFLGVLWPGDFWLPGVDYPWEAGHAVLAGQNVAKYINDNFWAANSVSFISHSLGGRVLLEAAKGMNQRAKQLCLAAGAVDDDCLAGQYLQAQQNAERISVMSSMQDKILQYAYPAGDFISDVFLGDNDSPFEQALGRGGPKAPFAPPVFDTAIPDNAGADGKGYDHGDYFPPTDLPKKGAPAGKWVNAVAFMARAVTGGAIYWK